MCIPNVFPLRGVVQKCYDHFYAGAAEPLFPPPGQLLELCYFSGIDVENLPGQFQRMNCDVSWLAWLMCWQKADGDTTETAKLIKTAQSITMRFTKLDNETSKLSRCYQIKEHEEASADLLGHSILTRARELSSLQVSPGSPCIRHCDRCGPPLRSLLLWFKLALVLSPTSNRNNSHRAREF
jgi:hypothetical protein